MTPILLVMAGILIGVLAKALCKFIKIPYTVLLFAIGIVFGLIYKTYGTDLWGDIDVGMDLIATMNPDFILYVFLPILVFDAAYEMDLHVFKKTLVNSSLLAGPGVVICMLLTACLVMGVITVFDQYDPNAWVYCLMFGGLISATDPVAVVALLQELGTSKRFSTLVDGESLLNDGTGLVCFMMFYSQFAGQGVIDRPFMYFVWVVVASFLIGFVIAKLAMWIVVRSGVEEMVQNCILIAAAYLTFIVAQKAFDVSGVIALVTFGHFFAQSGRPHLKPEVNEFMEKFWSFMAYIANTLIFLIVGVIIATRVNVTLHQIGYGIIIYVGLNIIRYIMIYMLYPILKRNGYGLTMKETIILGWGGLRGALGMSMALMVNCNQNLPQWVRDDVLIYTSIVVVLTLCVNATTSKWMVNKLHLIQSKSPAEMHIWNGFLDLIRKYDNEALDELKKNPYLKDADWKQVEKRMIAPTKYEEKVDDIIEQEDMLHVMRKMALAYEDILVEKYYSTGVLRYRIYNHMKTSLSVLGDFEGAHPLDERELTRYVHRRNWFVSRKTHTADMCNLCRGYAMIGIELKDYIQNSRKENTFNNGLEQLATDQVVKEIENLVNEANQLLEMFAKKSPEIFQKGITDRASRMLLADERKTIEVLKDNGNLNSEGADNLLADLAKRQNLEIV